MINHEQIFIFSELLISTTGENIQAKWQVPTSLPYFDGHFPQNPILPGVALLDLFQVLLNCQFESISSIKFTEPIRPLDSLNIIAQNIGGAKNWCIDVFNDKDLPVCKANIILR